MAETEFNLVHEGTEEELEKINKLPVGSEERLNAMKAFEIRYSLDLKEYDLGFKASDMLERRALEQERLEFEREKAEREAADREAAAQAEAERSKRQTVLAGLGLGGSVLFAILGYLVDKPDSDMIRNGNRERDRDRIFNFADKLRLK